MFPDDYHNPPPPPRYPARLWTIGNFFMGLQAGGYRAIFVGFCAFVLLGIPWIIGAIWNAFGGSVAYEKTLSFWVFWPLAGFLFWIGLGLLLVGLFLCFWFVMIVSAWLEKAFIYRRDIGLIVMQAVRLSFAEVRSFCWFFLSPLRLRKQVHRILYRGLLRNEAARISRHEQKNRQVIRRMYRKQERLFNAALTESFLSAGKKAPLVKKKKV